MSCEFELLSVEDLRDKLEELNLAPVPVNVDGSLRLMADPGDIFNGPVGFVRKEDGVPAGLPPGLLVYNDEKGWCPDCQLCPISKDPILCGPSHTGNLRVIEECCRRQVGLLWELGMHERFKLLQLRYVFGRKVMVLKPYSTLLDTIRAMGEP